MTVRTGLIASGRCSDICAQQASTRAWSMAASAH
jgi:hypothetical protein